MGEGVGDGVEGEVLDTVGDGDIECHYIEHGFEGEHEDRADQVYMYKAVEVIVLWFGKGFVRGLAQLFPSGSGLSELGHMSQECR